MDFYLHSYSDNNSVVRAIGVIKDGDAEKFVQLISNNPPTTKEVEISSPGGQVLAAVRLAEEIEKRSYGIKVIDECASACSQIIFPAGSYSIMAPGTTLGFHSCSRGGARDEICNEEIISLSSQRGFPYGTQDIFMSEYGPENMKWFTDIGARCFGFYHDEGDYLPINGLKPCVDGIIFTMEKGIKRRPFGPSFDCSKSTNLVEKLFCVDKELMFLDSVLGRVLDAATLRFDKEKKRKLIEEQRNWIFGRNSECLKYIPANLDFKDTRSGALCLYNYNSKRVYELITYGNNE